MDKLTIIEAADQWQEQKDKQPQIDDFLLDVWDKMYKGMPLEEAADRVNMDPATLAHWLFDLAERDREHYEKTGDNEKEAMSRRAGDWFSDLYWQAKRKKEPVKQEAPARASFVAPMVGKRKVIRPKGGNR